ncbi:MAG TPA: DNA polymerase III subunit alpha [bacterium]|nr:DNA polymerase III subunit alpha [bacterium]
MPGEFVHCHLHTEYSLLDGESRIEPLMRRAVSLGMRAISLTDHGAMYGAIEFYEAARAHGIKPIIGVEAYVSPRGMADRDPKLDASAFHLVLLARNDEGYRNLLKLTTAAHLDGFYYKPRIDRALLARHSGGLIGLSACLQGEIPRAILREDPAAARKLAGSYREIFGPGHFYLELQNHGIAEQQTLTRGLVALAKDTGLPLVATNDVHYVTRDEADAQDALMCIQMGIDLAQKDKPRMGDVPEFYLKSPDEMAARFADFPEALRSTLAIAEMCDLEIETGTTRLPHFPLPEGETADTYLRRLCETGLRRIYGGVTPALEERLAYELGVIAKTGYAAYFLIVQDFVNFARGRGIYTTVRGSAAGSLVLYACGVTDVDPIAYRLPFDRFLNLERYTMPDIDVDFMDSRRDEVIKYVVDKYGDDRVAQIITFGTLGARAAIRDLGRVMGLPYGDVDRIAKLVPGANVSLQEALAAEPELRAAVDGSPQIRQLMDMAQKLEGVARHASTHAAGVIISRDPLTDHVPLQRATKGDLLMTQYDMNSVARLGLLKIDFLGLTNLTILDAAIGLIRGTRGEEIDLQRLPLDDKPTYALLASGETTGIFQLEGRGMTRYLRELKPDRIEDVMAMVALFRPGPMANIPSYIRRKHGQEKVTYLHPRLEPVLKETYGVMVYQEDIMTVAQAIAGYTLAEADVLCYAIRKKIKDRLLAQREKFVAGARANGVDARTVDQIFEQFEPFARYGFNRAHAACYGLIAYYTAYLKAHYAAEYMTALLSSDVGNMDRVAQAVAECARMDLNVLPPDVNESAASFTTDGKVIRFGLTAVRNVGVGAIDVVIAAREAGGPFASLADFCGRVDTRLVNQRVIASLIKAGAFDRLGSRAQMLQTLDAVLERAQRSQRARNEAQTGLFGDLAAPEPAAAGPGEGDTAVQEFSKEELLTMEREMLGLYISDHPLRRWGPALAKRATATIAQLADLPDRKKVTIGGLIGTVKRSMTRSGSTMAFVTLEDLTGSIEVLVFPRAYEQHGLSLKRDAVVLLRGTLDVEEQSVKLLCDEVIALPPAPPEDPASLAVEEAVADGVIAGAAAAGAVNGGAARNGHGANGARPPAAQTAGGNGRAGARPALRVRVSTIEEVEQLERYLKEHPGPRRVCAHVVSGDGEHVIQARSGAHDIEELLQSLEQLFGEGNVWEE